ncbi:MAG: RNA polymerase sigma factor [Lentisphaerae bacterium]|jgi:RNA polymerase sigma-70 factor, ECF subfamily|nr:RNA polymerase sigma factor [Lentisphaerota bacterium]MBT4816935.1 RNA polymerase sigma factor [Lentisphaerota bacterium]MBT7053994.1 RNA polymerase sigma factor [Lentisphaerota bacterium]MBT7845761.1 RNA polymerase sigma factor [Lentisphaerota bacterium]
MAPRRALIESELLVVQHRLGKAGALEKLVELWEQPLYYYVRRLVNTEDEAKDVTQDIWLNVVRKIGAVRDPAAFPAWLYRVARTHAASHFRKTPSFESLPENGSVADAACANVNDLPSTLNAEELHWGLSHLSPPHSECLILHFLEGFSLEEVANIAGVPLGTVKSRIHYAKQALRDVLRQGASGNEKQ